MAFASLSAALSLNISNFSKNLSKAASQLSKFASSTPKSVARATEKYNKLAESAVKYATTIKNKGEETKKNYADLTKELGKHTLSLKDTARIVQGIMISQAFYRATHTINSATSALWDFNKELDYAQITYSALFGSPELASNFLSVLQEYSTQSIFGYEELADASKKLSAYGIEYKNLMYVMKGVSDLTVLTGDTAAMDRIAYALGQIYAKGKLTAEEMKQLANAYVPIQKILTEKMGLSGDDLNNVGKLNIGASATINAIVDYANEQFGAVSDAAMYTIKGLENKIVDTIKVMGVAMLQPLSKVYKSMLIWVSDGITKLREAFNTGGESNLFETLVPDPHLQVIIRQFIANVKNMLMSLATVMTLVGNIMGNAIYVLITAFNLLAPPILTVLNVISRVIYAILHFYPAVVLLRLAVLAAAAAFVVLRVHAIALAVMGAITKIVIGLAKAILLLGAASKVTIVLLALTLALVGIAVSSEKAGSALTKLFGAISKAAGGSGWRDIFDGTDGVDDASNAIDDYNDRLGTIGDNASEAADGVDKVGDSAKKTAQKMKSLLGFDEVFSLTNPSDSGSSAGSGNDSGVDDSVLADLDKLASGFKGLGEKLIPDIPDFSEFTSGFTDSLFGGLTKAFEGRVADGIVGATLGAIIGGLIGGLITGGSPAGIAIGAGIGILVGGIVGWFWKDLKAEFDKDPVGNGVAISIGTVVGAVFGGILGGPAGALIGAGIGIAISGIFAMFWDQLAEDFNRSPESATTAKIGSAIGGALGTVIGGLLGGPFGALIGGAIGTFAGGVIGMFWKEIASAFATPAQTLWTNFATAASTLFENAKKAFEEKDWLELGKNILLGILLGIGAAVTSIPAYVVLFFKNLWDSICKTFGIASPAKEMKPLGDFIGQGILEGIFGVFSNIKTWVEDNIFTPIKNALDGFSLSDLMDSAFEIGLNIVTTIGAIPEWLLGKIKDGASIAKNITANITSIIGAIPEWLLGKIKDGANLTKIVATTFSDKFGSLAEWFLGKIKTSANLTKTVATTFSDKFGSLAEWFLGKIKGGASVAKTVATTFSDKFGSLAEWFLGKIKTSANLTKSVAVNISAKFDSLLKWFLEKIKSGAAITKSVVAKVTGGSTKADGGVYANGHWSPIQAYASGGTPNAGQFFLAREAGPELVGTLGGHTAVMNNDQIVASVSSGVYAAVSSAIGSVGSIAVAIENKVADASNAITAAITSVGSASVLSRSDISRSIDSANTNTITLDDMLTFATAVADNVVASIAPQLATAPAGASQSSVSDLPPVYVGTLVADERGLKELERKLRVIRIQEERRGL